MSVENLSPRLEFDLLDDEEIEARKGLIHEALVNGIENAVDLARIGNDIRDVLHGTPSYGNDGGVREIAINRPRQRLMHEMGLLDKYEQLLSSIDEVTEQVLAQNVHDVNECMRTQSQFETIVVTSEGTVVISEVTAADGRVVPMLKGEPLLAGIESVKFRSL